MNEYQLKTDIIGLTLEEVKKMGYNYRVYSEDGQSYMITDDFHHDRINLEITNGLVTNLHLG